MTGSRKPKRAMVLAAGLGTRLRPITDDKPKPLVEVGGRSLIDRSLDRLEEAGVETVVVNLHHLGHMIEAQLGGRPSPEILYSREDALLDTGGGVAKALPHFGDAPFFVVNGDALWLNGPQLALERMTDLWSDGDMDALLLLHPTVDANGYAGRGDFCADPSGLLTRRPETDISPFLYTGVQLVHPRLFEGATDGAFSFNVLFDRAIESERLFGLVHDGEWFHIGTPQALDEAEAFMHAFYPGEKKR